MTSLLIPSWALFGLLAALLSASQMLVQDRFKAAAFPVAFWVKVATALLMAPLAINAGFPTDPLFYAFVAAQSLLWVVSDVVFYGAIKDSGAGVISRLMPSVIVISFFLWFLFDWPLASAYMARPGHSALVIVVLSLTAFFAVQLKKCQVTRRAFKKVWFVLVAAIIGSITTKLITRYADISQGVYAFVFVEALVMLGYWLIYYKLAKPVPKNVMFGKEAIKCGLTVGLFGGIAVAARLAAVYIVDNPAYVLAIKYLDAVLIVMAYRFIGKKEEAHVWAGLGFVACAIALILIKA